MAANERGHYPIEAMGVELGIRLGQYGNLELPWLRWWDSQGNLLLTGDERARIEHQGAETERLRAEKAELELQQERLRAERLAELLRSLLN